MPEQDLRLVKAAQHEACVTNVVHGEEGEGVLLSKNVPPGFHDLLVQGQGLVVATQLVVRVGEVAHAFERLWVSIAEGATPSPSEPELVRVACIGYTTSRAGPRPSACRGAPLHDANRVAHESPLAELEGLRELVLVHDPQELCKAVALVLCSKNRRGGGSGASPRDLRRKQLENIGFSKLR